MLKLFSKEQALYLVDNPIKVGLSWWFLFVGIAAGYGMHSHYGDSEYVIMIVEKYAFITSCAVLFSFWFAYLYSQIMAYRNLSK